MHQKRHLQRRAAWAVLAPAVTLLLVGCGDDKPKTAASRASASATAAVAAPSSAPPSASASASPALPKAKDGRRLSACADARCEVEVKAGDVIHFNAGGMRKAGFGDVKVKSVQVNKVLYDLASGSATFTQPGPNRTANVNGISLTLVRADGKHAVIRVGGLKKGALTVHVGGGGGMSVTTPGG
jgi:hypothetical protein